MKRILSIFTVLAAATMLSGCWVLQKPEPPPAATAIDKDIVAKQVDAQKECYKSLKKPDMAGWSAEKVASYMAIEKLGEANRLLAGKSIDPCESAGGTNVYAVQVALVQEETKVRTKMLETADSLVTKGMIAIVASKVIDGLGKGETISTHGDGSPILIQKLSAKRDGVMGPVSVPATAPETNYLQSGTSGSWNGTPTNNLTYK